MTTERLLRRLWYLLLQGKTGYGPYPPQRLIGNVPLPIGHHNRQGHRDMRPRPHERPHNQHIRDVDMPRRIQRRRRMIRADRAGELAHVLLPAVQRRVHGELVLADDGLARDRFGALAVRARAEDGRFFEGELEAAEDDGVEVVGLEARPDLHAVAGPVARLRAVDGELHAVLREVAALGLLVDGPDGVQLVLVDGDGRHGRGDDGLSATEPASVVGQLRIAYIRVDVLLALHTHGGSFSMNILIDPLGFFTTK